MKNNLKYLVMAVFAMVSCSKQSGGPFNYELIKSKLELSEEQATQFDDITSKYMTELRSNFEGEGSREDKMTKAKAISAKQDTEMKEILTADQFATYEVEINIERNGREKHNMSLIRDALALDSTQITKFNLANEAFYTTLRDNHDYYHGKPDVYKQYYKEIDLSRQKVFKEIMSDEKYAQYKTLEEQYKIGKSEH